MTSTQCRQFPMQSRPLSESTGHGIARDHVPPALAVDLKLPSIEVRQVPADSESRMSMPSAAPRSPLSPSFSKAATQPKPLQTNSPPKQRKRSAFRNFFSTKEPSSQALRDYKETLQKQQSSQGPRSSTVGMFMVSSAKMPEHVPKVNAKWEGVPDKLLEKEKAKKERKGRPSSMPFFDGRSASMSSGGTRAVSKGSSSIFSFPATPRSRGRDSFLSRPETSSRSTSTEASDWTQFSGVSASTPLTPRSEADSTLTSREGRP